MWLMMTRARRRPWERWDDPGVAARIDAYWTSNPGESCHRRALAAFVSRHARGAPVLEVGSGTGLVYEMLVPEVLANDGYLGMDVSAQMVDIAIRRFPAGRFIRADAHRMPFADGAFDMVIAFEVLCHMPALQAPLREMFRVSRRKVLFTTWYPGPYKSRLEVTDEGFIYWRYSPEDVLGAVREVAPDSLAAGGPAGGEKLYPSILTWSVEKRGPGSGELAHETKR